MINHNLLHRMRFRMSKHHYNRQNYTPYLNPLFIAYTRFCLYSCLFYKTKHQQFKFLRVSSKVLPSVGSPQLSIQNTNQAKEFCRFSPSLQISQLNTLDSLLLYYIRVRISFQECNWNMFRPIPCHS